MAFNNNHSLKIRSIGNLDKNQKLKGAIIVVIVWYLDLQLPVQSVPITTNVVRSNNIHGEVYSIQHYVIKFVSDLWQVGGFLRILGFPPPKKTDRHDITKILLKVALNTINLTLSKLKVKEKNSVVWFCFSLHLTTMCLLYKSTIVACVCVHLACKWSKWEVRQYET